MAAYGATLTVDTGKIPSSQSNFTWLLTTDNFPVAAIDGGGNSILNGGGNLRCYTDNTKTTQLPIEVVSFATGGTPSIQVWGLSPLLGVADTVYIEADTTVTSQPTASDTYGSEKVWVDFYSAYHFELAGNQLDSSGNNNTLTENGTVSISAGKFGNKAVFNGVSANYYDAANIRSNTSFEISCWLSSVTDGRFLFDDSTGVDGGAQVFVIGGKLRARLDDSLSGVAIVDTTTSVNDGVLILYHLSVNKAGSIGHYINGVADGSAVNISSFGDISPTAATTTIGNRETKSSALNGSTEEFRIRALSTTADYKAAEYNNQSDPSTFWVTSAWEEQGGVGIILTPSAIATTETFGTPNVELLLTKVSPEGVLSLEAFGSPNVSTGITLTPVGVATAEEVGEPLVRLRIQIITSNGVVTGEVLGRPVLIGGEEPAFYLVNQGVKYTVNGAILIDIVS